MKKIKEWFNTPKKAAVSCAVIAGCLLVLGTGTGGLSGPAVFPLAVRMVWQVYEAVGIPIVGMGGVRSAADALELMLAGATAVGVGAANLVDPYAARDIALGLPSEMEKYNITDLKSIIGGAHNG